MADFSLVTAARVMVQTWPFLLLRAVILFCSSAIGLIMVAGCGLAFYHVGVWAGDWPAGSDEAWSAAALGVVFGIVLFLCAVLVLREYMFTLVKAAHMAVVAQVLDGGEIAGAMAKLTVGFGFVRANFITTTKLHLIIQAIRQAAAVLETLADQVLRAMSAGPATGFLRRLLSLTLGHAGDVMLVQVIRAPQQPFAETIAAALVLFRQNAPALGRNAVLLSLLQLCLTILLYGAALVLIGLLALQMTDFYRFAAVAAGIGIMAWVLERVFIRSFILVLLLQVLMRLECQAPSP